MFVCSAICMFHTRNTTLVHAAHTRETHGVGTPVAEAALVQRRSDGGPTCCRRSSDASWALSFACLPGQSIHGTPQGSIGSWHTRHMRGREIVALPFFEQATQTVAPFLDYERRGPSSPSDGRMQGTKRASRREKEKEWQARAPEATVWTHTSLSLCRDGLVFRV